jgi:hypothetical protein
MLDAVKNKRARSEADESTREGRVDHHCRLPTFPCFSHSEARSNGHGHGGAAPEWHGRRDVRTAVQDEAQEDILLKQGRRPKSTRVSRPSSRVSGPEWM